MSNDLFDMSILLVDDKVNNLYALKEVILLHFPKTTIMEAKSGIEALTIAKTEQIDIILMDVKMPDMDGFETANLLKGRAKTSHIPIIFLTAYDSNSSMLKSGLAAGRLHYLTKPLDEDKLIKMLSLYIRFISLKRSDKEKRSH